MSVICFFLGDFMGWTGERVTRTSFWMKWRYVRCEEKRRKDKCEWKMRDFEEKTSWIFLPVNWEGKIT